MRRRDVLLGMGAAAVAGGWFLRPNDRGAPYDDYFRGLNEELRKNGPMRPVMLIDLDRLDANLGKVTSTLKRAGKHYRVVEKSLPCPKLLDYICKRAGTRRLMSFHQPFLNHDAVLFPDADVLLGKPLPVRSAELFYRKLRGPFDPARQLQWLIDTPERLQQYLELAKGLGTRLLVNLEIDVGLHRGGAGNNETLGALLDLIAANPQHLEFSGFMGYEPFVGFGVPKVLGTPQELLAKAMDRYQGYVDFARGHSSRLWREGLTLNTGGSPSYSVHGAETLSTEVCTGTALLKPTHYDIETLVEHVPAAFIATPVIKATGTVTMPVLDEKVKIVAWWDPNRRETYFIYGGYWLAEYESPAGLQFNELFGHSANQEGVNGSVATALNVDDHVFLRPAIAEGVLLQFGDLVILRGGKIVDYWPVMSETG